VFHIGENESFYSIVLHQKTSKKSDENCFSSGVWDFMVIAYF